jgi:DNA recombination-dependent growth factor C
LKGEGRPFYQQRKRQQRLQELFPQIVAVILPKNFGRSEVRSAWIKKRGITTLVVVDEDEKIKNKWQLMRELGGGVEVVAGLKTIEGKLVSMSQILQKTQNQNFLIFAEDKRLVEEGD